VLRFVPIQPLCRCLGHHRYAIKTTIFQLTTLSELRNCKVFLRIPKHRIKRSGTSAYTALLATFMVSPDSSTSWPTGGVLTSTHVAEAILGADAPGTLHLSHLNISEIPDGPVHQLSRLRDPDDGIDECAIRR
jgi:hypothetical protein